MKIEFILRVWHKETEELLAEVSSSSIALDDVRDLLQDVMPDDKELVAAVYVPKPGAEERLATLFGVDAVSGVYSLSREQV